MISTEQAAYDSEREEVMTELFSRGEIPYWIPGGASTHPLGGLGYARFAFELAEQEQEMNVYFDTIILPCNGGSTLGGIISGFKLIEKTAASSNKGSRKQRKSIGVDAFSGPPGDETRILQIARTAATKIGLEESDIQECGVEIDMRWNAGASGFVDERTQEALKLMVSLEGILTDPVYTGKALARMIGKA
jgi:1-aminocyclopropane-1-carboxylate deaminase